MDRELRLEDDAVIGDGEHDEDADAEHLGEVAFRGGQQQVDAGIDGDHQREDRTLDAEHRMRRNQRNEDEPGKEDRQQGARLQDRFAQRVHQAVAEHAGEKQERDDLVQPVGIAGGRVQHRLACQIHEGIDGIQKNRKIAMKSTVPTRAFTAFVGSTSP